MTVQSQLQIFYFIHYFCHKTHPFSFSFLPENMLILLSVLAGNSIIGVQFSAEI